MSVSTVTEYVPYEDADGEVDYAEVSRLAVCEEHGLERVARERDVSTGVDLCRVGVFACGAIVKDDVF